MNIKWIKRTVLFVICGAIFTGCVSYVPASPDAFAEYKIKNKTYRAITSDGVRLRIRQIDNEPYGTSGMWMQAVDLVLTGRGYHEIGKKDLEVSTGQKGAFTEYLYRHYGDNYIYGIALFADKDNIYLVETTGEEGRYKKRKSALIKSIGDLKLDQ